MNLCKVAVWKRTRKTSARTEFFIIFILSTGFSNFHKINTKLSKQFKHENVHTFRIHCCRCCCLPALLLLLNYFVHPVSKFILSLFLSLLLGRPAPKVTWWRDNVELISSTSHPSADEGASAVVNQLFIGTVTRDFYGTRLECRAQGSKLLPPVVKEITVQVHCECKNYFLLTFYFCYFHSYTLCCWCLLLLTFIKLHAFVASKK